MLGIERSAARYTWTAAVVLLFIYLVYLLRSTLFIFALALLFAYLLSPLVDLLDRALPRKGTRTLALALAYVIFVGTVVLVGIQVGTRVEAQAETLALKLPEMMAKYEQPSTLAPQAVNSFKAQVIANIRQEWAARSSDIMHALPAAGMKFLSVASNLIYVVIVPVLAFFFLKDGDLIRRHTLEIRRGSTARRGGERDVRHPLPRHSCARWCCSHWPPLLPTPSSSPSWVCRSASCWR
jgi:predicted PurR-regulated permease PerM